MLTNKENIIAIEEWTLSDLYEGSFWLEVFSTINSNRSVISSNLNVMKGNSFKSLNPVIKEKVCKDQLIEFLWDILPTENKVSFFDQEYTVFYIWASLIHIGNLIKLHDHLVNRKFNRVPDLISGTDVYKKMVESRNKAFSDMKNIKNTKDTKDMVLMKFYDKLKEEDVISLNTPDYILVSGTDDEQVQGLNDKLLEEKYTLIYSMDYTYGSDVIPIYVFHLPKLK